MIKREYFSILSRTKWNSESQGHNFFFTKAYSFENTYSCCNSEFLSYFIKSVTEIKLFVEWVYKRTINYVENGKVIRQNGKTVTVG